MLNSIKKFQATVFAILILTITAESQIVKILNVKAGELDGLVTFKEVETITHLTLRGTIDYRDFQTLKNNYINLIELDLRSVNVKKYTTDQGFTYSENAVPRLAFSKGFQGLLNLKRVLLPYSVLHIGESAFAYCRNLKSVVLPEYLLSIGFGAFYDCQSLEYIIMPNSLESIGGSAFSNCLSLSRIIIPQKITTIKRSH